MLFYILSLLAGLFGSAALTYGFCRSLDRNYGRRNKRPISYLAPVFLSLILIYFTIDFTAPRLFDLVTLASGNYEVEEIRLTDDQIHWASLEIDGSPHLYNRFQYKPEPGTTYRLTALPNSRHVVKLDPVASNTDIGGNHVSQN